MGRIVLNRSGAARRPAPRGRLVLVVLGAIAFYLIGYAAVAALKGR